MVILQVFLGGAYRVAAYPYFRVGEGGGGVVGDYYYVVLNEQMKPNSRIIIYSIYYIVDD